MECNEVLHEHRLWQQGLEQGPDGSLVCSKGSSGNIILGVKLVCPADSSASHGCLPFADSIRWPAWGPAPLISGAGSSTEHWGSATVSRQKVSACLNICSAACRHFSRGTLSWQACLMQQRQPGDCKGLQRSCAAAKGLMLLPQAACCRPVLKPPA